MADIKRLNYFTFQFLVEKDFDDEQAYHIGMRRRHNIALHSWGVADGFLVEQTASQEVSIGKGLAVDKDGNEIILADPATYSLAGVTTDTYLVIEYHEEFDPADHYTAGGVDNYTRTMERPRLTHVASPANDGSVIILAKIYIGAGGNISSVDNTVKTRAGSSSAPGSITTAALANGAVTLEKIAASAQPIVSIDGVSNPGGDIDLIAANAVTITPDDAGNRITISETHSVLTNNPHGTTAAQVGAVVSVDGVSNPGGNIDLIAANAVTITPDDAGNRITISETHSVLTNNPHGTTATQVGALPAAGGVVAGNVQVNGNVGVGIAPAHRLHVSAGDEPDGYTYGVVSRVDTGAAANGTVALSGVASGSGNGTVQGLNVSASGAGAGFKSGIYSEVAGGGNKEAGYFNASSPAGAMDQTTALVCAADSAGDGFVQGVTVFASGAGAGQKSGLSCGVSGGGYKQAGSFSAYSPIGSTDQTNGLSCSAYTEGDGGVQGLSINASGSGAGYKNGLYCNVSGGGNKQAGQFSASSGAGTTEQTNGISCNAGSEGDGYVQGLNISASGNGAGQKSGLQCSVSGGGHKQAASMYANSPAGGSDQTLCLTCSAYTEGDGYVQGISIQAGGSGNGQKSGLDCSVSGGGYKQAGSFAAYSAAGTDQANGIACYAGNEGDGGAQGLSVQAYGNGTGQKSGLYCTVSGGGYKQAGYFNANSPAGTTDQTNGVYCYAYSEGSGGVQAQYLGANSYGTGAVQMLAGDAYSNGNGTVHGMYANVSGAGTGLKYGTQVNVYGSGEKYGGYYNASSGTGTDMTTAMYGSSSSSGNGTVYGINVTASGNGTGTKYGIYSSASGTGGTKYAGYFSGNVHVAGTLSKTSGTFLIDHPLDPYNKTLRHSFVESPENLCLYRGKVKLDAAGKAEVELPDYFGALVKEEEATITLTPVGNKPFLVGYVWNKKFASFTVFGEAGGEATYLVLADRDDPAIHLLRRPVEEQKGDGYFEKGKLIFPEAYGEKPETPTMPAVSEARIKEDSQKREEDRKKTAEELKKRERESREREDTARAQREKQQSLAKEADTLAAEELRRRAGGRQQLDEERKRREQEQGLHAAELRRVNEQRARKEAASEETAKNPGRG